MTYSKGRQKDKSLDRMTERHIALMTYSKGRQNETECNSLDRMT